MEKTKWESDLAENYIQQLMDISVGNSEVPEVYSSFGEFIGELSLDLHWTFEERIKDLIYVLLHQNFDMINESLKSKFNYDLKADIEMII